MGILYNLNRKSQKGRGTLDTWSQGCYKCSLFEQVGMTLWNKIIFGKRWTTSNMHAKIEK